MSTTGKSKLIALLVMHLAWGCVLWFSISKYGLGISTDSVPLLFGGRNLVAGNGLVSYDGNFLVLWPPLYPTLLGFVHLVTGTTMLTAAAILQVAAFVGVSVCSSILFLRAFPARFGLAFAASLLADIGAVVLTSFDVVGSDYLELFLIVLCILLTSTYVHNRSGKTYVWLAVVGMLAMLDRYLGVAAVITSAGCALLMTEGSSIQRLGRAFFLGLGAAPAGLWLAITSRQYQLRGPISFGENFSWFSKSILDWFFETRAVKTGLEAYTVVLWVIVVILIAGVVLSLARQWREGPGFSGVFTVPMLTFGAVYTVALFASASIDFFNKLGGRFLLPAYIPFVTLLVASVAILQRPTEETGATAWRLGAPLAGGAALLATAVLLLRVTLPLVFASHADGAAGGDNVYNTKAWNKNEAIAYWRANVPQGKYELFSNAPDGVAFFSDHDTSSSPRRTSGPYGTDIYALGSYTPELFGTSEPVYLIWIEPNAATYLYTVDDLRTIANVTPLFVSGDGGVYRLSPKAGT